MKKIKRMACMILCGLMLWTLAGCAEQPPKVPDTDAASKITYNTNIIAAIQNDGRVVIAGLSMGAGRGQYAAHKWKDIRQIDSSGLHIVGVKKDGTAVACGYNSEGQCDVMDWTNVKQAAAISSETIALFEDGTLGTTNPEHAEEFSAARDITAIACDKLYGNVIALKENGTAEAFITYPPFQSLAREVEKWKDITQVSAGLGYFTGLKEDGTVLFAGGVIESADGTGRGEVKDWTEHCLCRGGRLPDMGDQNGRDRDLDGILRPGSKPWEDAGFCRDEGVDGYCGAGGRFTVGGGAASGRNGRFIRLSGIWNGRRGKMDGHRELDHTRK